MCEMRRIVLAALLVALPLPSVAAPRAHELNAGEAVFLRGPHLEGPSDGETWTYALRVTESAYRLRVGIDHPEVDDTYDVSMTTPEGDSRTFSAGGGLYSAEHLERDPAIGLWRIRVTARDVTDSDFRLRARLEARPPSLGARAGAVLPNLQVLPPHEASFLMPVTNGATPGADSTGLDLLGAESCHPEEHIEEQALRCLRFAFGIRNTGRGPLQLHFSGGVPNDHELFQRVQRADGGSFDRKVGVAKYHKTHAHYHHDDAVALRLFKVTDRKRGALEAAGEKHFKGFAHRDELLRDWHTFYPTWTPFGFGLLAGWADIYEWDRPGNYIDFGLNGDGHYVLRMWADPIAGVLESNERDNAGYTYFEVTGSEIDLIEAGRGKHPWDPCRIEVGFGGHPDPKPRPRPARCPPDTA